MLAALPDDGPVPGWTAWLVLLPPLVAFAAAAWSQWVWPTVYYVEGAVRGTAGGVVAGLAFGVAGVPGGRGGRARQDAATSRRTPSTRCCTPSRPSASAGCSAAW